jgi:hypothetical protein
VSDVTSSPPKQLVDAMSAVSKTCTFEPWHDDTEHAVWQLLQFGGVWGEVRATDIVPALEEVAQQAQHHKAWVRLVLDEESRPATDQVLEPVDLDQWSLLTQPSVFGGVVAVDERRLHVRVRGVGVRHLLCNSTDVPDDLRVRTVTEAYREVIPWCAHCAGQVASSYARVMDLRLDTSGD